MSYEKKGPGASTPSPQHNAIKPLEDSKKASENQGFIELEGDERSTAVALIEGAMAGCTGRGVNVTVDYEGAPPACATVLVVLDRGRFLELAVAGWAPSLQLPAQELLALITQVHGADWTCEDMIDTLRDPDETKRLLRNKLDREETADELEREFQERGRICETIIEIARDPARLAGAIPAAASVWARASATGDAP
ncbi:MAG: hypothetical protein ACK59B_16215 [Alphaproteobacteria bacterium]